MIRFVRRSWILPLLVGTVATIMVVAVTRSSHCWTKSVEVRVTRDGKVAPESSVFYSRAADIWLIKIEGDETWYSFYPAESGMGVCSSLHNHIVIPGYLLLRNAPEDVPCVRFSPVQAADPQLVIRSDYLEFTSLKKERVRVSWGSSLIHPAI